MSEMKNFYSNLGEGVQPDPELDIDGALLEENFGKQINESYDINELSQPLNEKEK